MIAAEVEAPIVGTSLRSRRRPMSGSFLAAIRQCPPSSTVLSRWNAKSYAETDRGALTEAPTEELLAALPLPEPATA